MKEKLTPAQKPVPSNGGVQDGANRILTTPKQDNNGRYWGGAEKGKGSILGK